MRLAGYLRLSSARTVGVTTEGAGMPPITLNRLERDRLREAVAEETYGYTSLERRKLSPADRARLARALRVFEDLEPSEDHGQMFCLKAPKRVLRQVLGAARRWAEDGFRDFEEHINLTLEDYTGPSHVGCYVTEEELAEDKRRRRELMDEDLELYAAATRALAQLQPEAR
jgi:hypothetical protein